MLPYYNNQTWWAFDVKAALEQRPPVYKVPINFSVPMLVVVNWVGLHVFLQTIKLNSIEKRYCYIVVSEFFINSFHCTFDFIQFYILQSFSVVEITAIPFKFSSTLLRLLNDLTVLTNIFPWSQRARYNRVWL